MAGDNQKPQEGVLRKKCPFSGFAWCIGDDCAIWVTLTKQGVGQLGVKQVRQEGMCSQTALCILLSELKMSSSQAQQAPQKPFNLPPILRG